MCVLFITTSTPVHLLLVCISLLCTMQLACKSNPRSRRGWHARLGLTMAYKISRLNKNYNVCSDQLTIHFCIATISCHSGLVWPRQTNSLALALLTPKGFGFNEKWVFLLFPPPPTFFATVA